MSKVDDLASLKRMALKEAVEWLDLAGRVEANYNGWLKERFVEYLSRKLSVIQTDTLVAGYEPDGPPHFGRSVLIEVFGLPSKDAMLGGVSKEGLLAVMRHLDETGACRISYRSLPAYELREYLKNKLTVSELAEVLGLVENEGDGDEAEEDDRDILPGLRGEIGLEGLTVAETLESPLALVFLSFCFFGDQHTLVSRLLEEQPDTLIREVITKKWGNHIDRLWDCTTTIARSFGFIETIAALVGLPVEQVIRRIEQAHWNKPTKSLFPERSNRDSVEVAFRKLHRMRGSARRG